MSIAHELSCDVAAAMLAGQGKDGPADATARVELTDVVLEVHTTLRRLTRESREARFNSRPAAAGAAQACGGVSPHGH